MESHLLQMRGLKQYSVKGFIRKSGSHLLQMRGLKPPERVCRGRPDGVASFTDAWIETVQQYILPAL